jgi:hypothetical protein
MPMVHVLLLAFLLLLVSSSSTSFSLRTKQVLVIIATRFMMSTLPQFLEYLYDTFNAQPTDSYEWKSNAMSSGLTK